MSRLTVALFFVLACTSNQGPDPSGDNHPVCGDGVCNASEIHTCPADCGMPGSGSGSSGAVCGNDVCEAGENSTNCPSDCTPPGSMCGDGICESGETSANCPEDCPAVETFDCTTATTQSACMVCFEDDAQLGLGACDEFDDAFPGDANDCAMCVANGTFGSACESQCGGGESQACAQCEILAEDCGDGVCEVAEGENEANCPADCPMVPCGDGICDVQSGETSITCSSDCLLADSFDCSSEINQTDCEDCFFADSTAEGGTLGECTANDDVPGGSAADCAKCASIGTFGSDCETFCGSGETNTCATCVAQDL